MIKETKIGTNRTGIQMSPEDSAELVEAASRAVPTSELSDDRPPPFVRST